MLIDYIQLMLISRQLNLRIPLGKCPVGLDQNTWARVYKNGFEKKNYFISGLGRTPKREKLFQWVGPITKGIDIHFSNLKPTLFKLRILRLILRQIKGI